MYPCHFSKAIAVELNLFVNGNHCVLPDIESITRYSLNDHLVEVGYLARPGVRTNIRKLTSSLRFGESDRWKGCKQMLVVCSLLFSSPPLSPCASIYVHNRTHLCRSNTHHHTSRLRGSREVISGSALSQSGLCFVRTLRPQGLFPRLTACSGPQLTACSGLWLGACSSTRLRA
jgi:hypothetical protein